MSNFALLAADIVTRKFEFGRIQANYEWWIYGGILALILAPWLWVYRRDTRELPLFLGIVLPLLRTVVLVGLLFVYLQPRWRVEREERQDSRVLVMVDTSQSMARLDRDTPAGRAGQTRLQEVIKGLEGTPFLDQLRKVHEVTVIPFNSGIEQERRLKLAKGESGTVPPSEDRESREAATKDSGQGPANDPAGPATVDWTRRLPPGGSETRLGEALEQVVRDERNTPVSGIVLISDGGLNAGRSADTALDLARESHIPIHAVGVGSEQKVKRVRVADFSAPPRVFPNDQFSVEGAVQGYGMKNADVVVELRWREGEAAGDPLRRGQGDVAASTTVTLEEDGKAVPVRFQLPSWKEGKRVLCLRVNSPALDSGGDDQFLEAEVESTEHKTRVLLLAGGPMRDYQYLRTLLFRDKSMVVDVFLQSGKEGISQEAAKILTSFPSSMQQLADYDCIVGFDPDWQALTKEQVDALYDWVDKDHGGLIVVAGSVHAGRTGDGWVQNPELGKIRKLYPVVFHQGFTTRTNVTYGSEKAVALDFSRAGLQSAYLWLGNSAEESCEIWKQFEGVYSFCPLRGKKEGATVLARFREAKLAVDGELPIYMAVHRISASPVLYIGSAETWRLRRLDPTHFATLWTKLIRFASQEHLRRQSAQGRGSLSIDNDRYPVGSTIEIRAELKNSDLGPMGLPEVPLQVTRDGAQQPVLRMTQEDVKRPGRYTAQLTVWQPGEYRLTLPVPQSSERLTQTFRAVVPKLEEENPQRNVALLKEIAKKTGGGYFGELSAAFAGEASLASRLKDVGRRDKVPLATQAEEDEKLLRWMLIALCTILGVEWLVRRLVKLA